MIYVFLSSFLLSTEIYEDGEEQLLNIEKMIRELCIFTTRTVLCSFIYKNYVDYVTAKNLFELDPRLVLSCSEPFSFLKTTGPYYFSGINLIPNMAFFKFFPVSKYYIVGDASSNNVE